MITEYEKLKVIEAFNEIAATIAVEDSAPLVYKVIANFIDITSPGKEIGFNESDFKSQKEAAEKIREAFHYIVKVATSNVSVKLYTTGQLSKYFGVSITSINKWIKEGRFLTIDRSVPRRHVRIPENALWRSASGELIPVKEIVEDWEARNKNQRISEEEELLKEIGFLERRYGGIYEETLKVKEQKTELELQDQEEWEYLLKRLAE